MGFKLHYIPTDSIVCVCVCVYGEGQWHEHMYTCAGVCVAYKLVVLQLN